MIKFPVSVVHKTREAEDVFSFYLARGDGMSLPAFTAGSHIDVTTPCGQVRQYSLCNGPNDRGGYLIAIQLDQNSRGGSKSMHALNIGDSLTISEPRNHFRLADSKDNLLIAGGIGITPILAMADELERSHASFELHYSARNPAKAAFGERIRNSSYQNRSHFHFSEGGSGSRLDVHALLEGTKRTTHIYVCGPASLADAVFQEAKKLGWRAELLHKEYFSNVSSNGNSHDNSEFEISLLKSGQTFLIPEDKSVLQVMLENGIDIPFSCESGVCGTCLTAVAEGIPDHRDAFLTDEERSQNNQFTPCCSRSKSRRLVLDI